jgi:hypothetical protein
MAHLEAIGVAVGAGFAFVVVMMLIVIAGIRKEERHWTLMHRRAPGVAAWIGRLVLGRYVRVEYDPAPHDYPDDHPDRYRGPIGPRRR